MQMTFLASLFPIVILSMSLPSAVAAQGRDRHRSQSQPVRSWQPRAQVVIAAPPIYSSGRSSVQPAGWDRGRKTGWGSCNMPPGLAKKVGCGQPIFRYGIANGRVQPRRTPVIVIPVP